MKKFKDNQGITLVALIVTIIILLILAGVTIALLSGEDGILSRTEKAATTYETESIKEVVNLKLANLNAGKWIDEGRKAVLKDLNELDDENSGNFDAEVTLKNQVGDSDTSAILIYDHHEIEVDSLLNITKVDGEKIASNGNNNAETGGQGSSNSGNMSDIDEEKVRQIVAEMMMDENQVKQIVKDTAINEDNVKQIAQEEFDKKIADIEVYGIYDTIFEGNATKGGTYNLTKSINNYKYIVVYAHFGNGTVGTSTIISKECYQIGQGKQTQCIGTTGAGSYMYWLSFNFPSDMELNVYSSAIGGWSGTPAIYLIKGVK